MTLKQAEELYEYYLSKFKNRPSLLMKEKPTIISGLNHVGARAFDGESGESLMASSLSITGNGDSVMVKLFIGNQNSFTFFEDPELCRELITRLVPEVPAPAQPELS